MILALARSNPKKNLTTLVKAFGECRPLTELANLVCSDHSLIVVVIVLCSYDINNGIRDNIDEMLITSASVVLSVIKMIDKYDIYGQVVYPKHHKQSEVPDINQLAAKTKLPYQNLLLAGFYLT